MIPHERSLVNDLKNAPFALIGVNSDKDRADLKKFQEKSGVSWRSFFDGGSTKGPIATRWNVSGWPTIYIVDAKGTIRYKSVGADEAKIDKMVRALVAEAEAAGG